MNYLDLFSGIGGFALGTYWAGWRFERHYFSEIDPWCCKLYQQRFPDAVPLGDITKIKGLELVADAKQSRGQGGEVHTGNVTKAFRSGEADSRESGRDPWIITGGFPCQDISVAGKGAGIKGLRSGLWFEYARLIGEIRPRYAIMENVGALTRRGLDRVLGSLAEIGYDAQWSDIRASDVGAPHRRERIWIVAYPGRGEQRSIPGFRNDGDGQAQGEKWGREPGIESRQDSETFPNAISGREWKSTNRARAEGSTDHAVKSDWWSVEPDVGRVAHGIPSRVDRLRGLGNAIVPQIAEMIFRGLSAQGSANDA